MIGTTEIMLIVLAILVLFGGRKIPELARGIGSSFREFKDAMNGEAPAKDSKKKITSKKSKSKK